MPRRLPFPAWVFAAFKLRVACAPVGFGARGLAVNPKPDGGSGEQTTRGHPWRWRAEAVICSETPPLWLTSEQALLHRIARRIAAVSWSSAFLYFC